MSVEWTTNQKIAIESHNTNLIVAASAGSGKTSAMIERALAIIINGTPVERILMLTFGEAAAAEMKEKLRNALIEYAKKAKEDKPFIIEQIDNMARADICTIHSFCKSIVKNNFEAVDVNPSLSIADSETAGVLASKAIKNLLQKETVASTPSFVALRDMLSPRDDKDLTNIIFKIYEHMSTQADRYGWLETTFDAEYNVDIEHSVAVKYIINYFVKKALILKKKIGELQKAAINLEEPPFIQNSKCLLEKIDGYTNCITLKDLFIEREKARVIAWKNLTPTLKKSTLCEITSALREEVNSFEKEIKKQINNINYEDAKNSVKGSSAQIRELIRLVKAYDEEYSKVKHENDVLDFADLEKFALIVLSDEEKRGQIQNNYDYVFVDEYQDTNYVQEKIISLIAPADSLFVVGDSKQSIYRFRLAEPEIFIDKLNEYKKHKQAVYFNDNFRSSPEILSFVNDVFCDLMSKEFGGVDYKNEAKFNIPLNSEKVSDYPPVEIIAVSPLETEEKECNKSVYSVKDAEKYIFKSKGIAEGRLIAERITRLVAREHIKTKEGVRLIDYKDIAIMFRKRSNANGIISELIKCGIPLRLGQFAVSEQSEDVVLLINYLKLLNNRREDYTLLAVMHSPIGGFVNSELAEIRKRIGGRQPFYEAAMQCANGNDEIGNKLNAFYNTVDQFEFKAQYTTVANLLRKILVETGYADYISSHAGGKDRLIVLEYFISNIEDKAFSRSVNAFIDYYTEHEENIDWGKANISASDGVNVSTIHACKGLEYPVVILAGSACPMKGNRQQLPALVDKDLGIGANYYESETRCKKPSIVMNGIAVKKAEEEKEDDLRLLYVALTRAKSHLIITGETDTFMDKAAHTSKSYFDWIMSVISNNKKLLKLVTQAEGGIGAVEKEKEVYFNKPIEHLKERFCKEYEYKYPYQDSTQIGIKYSVTAINKEEDIIIPSIFEEERRIKGVDYHKIMQYISYDDYTIEGVRAEIERLIYEDIITKEEAEGIDIGIISKCLSNNVMRIAAANKCLREKRFMMAVKANEIKQTIAEDTIIIQGTIDLLILGEETIIVDFKYSNMPEKIIAEKYKKQLQIYKKAVESANNIKVDRLIIYVFGSDIVIEL